MTRLKAIVLTKTLLAIALLLSSSLIFSHSTATSPQIVYTPQNALSDYTFFDYASFNTRTETVKELPIYYHMFGVRINYKITFNATTPENQTYRLKAIIKMRNATSGNICGVDTSLFETSIIDVDYVNGSDLNSTKKGGCDYYQGMIIYVLYDGAKWTVRDYNNASNVFATFPCPNFTLRAIEASGEAYSTTAGYAEVTTEIETLQPVPISAKAARFLSNYTYNPAMGLCSEVHGKNGNSIGFNGQVYWICTDNMFAWLALQNYNPTISNTIKANIESYAMNYTLPRDLRGLPITYKHEPIYGDILPPGTARNPNNYTLKDGTSGGTPYIIKTEVDNGTLWTTWPRYADILAWKGMSYLNQGDNESALRCYDAMRNMWDGYGFADAQYFNCSYYETFKLALAIILRQRLGLPKPFQEDVMDDILLVCQQPNGGIATGYDRHLNTTGHIENTETTALVVIANVTKLPSCPIVPSAHATIPVGVFYYAWYNGTGSGICPDQGHWNSTTNPKWAVEDTPLIGFYNSGDPNVVYQQLSEMSRMGISFIVVSWWGMPPYDRGQQASVNTAVKTLYMVANASFPNIKIVIMVEGFNESGTYNFNYIKSYIYSTFYNAYPNERFFLNNSTRPLLCWWNAPIMTGLNENPNWANVDAIHNDTVFEDKILGQSSSYVDWYAWRPCSVDSDEIPVINSNDGVVVVEPRYDGSHVGQGLNTVFDPTYSQDLYDAQWNYVLKHRDSVKCVLIYSWNEYHERSQIEPCNQPFDVNAYYCYGKTVVSINQLEASLPCSSPNPSVWLIVASGVLGAVVASGIVAFYFLKVRKKS